MAEKMNELIETVTVTVTRFNRSALKVGRAYVIQDKDREDGLIQDALYMGYNSLTKELSFGTVERDYDVEDGDIDTYLGVVDIGIEDIEGYNIFEIGQVPSDLKNKYKYAGLKGSDD